MVWFLAGGRRSRGRQKPRDRVTAVPGPELEALVARSREIVSRLQRLGEVAEAAIRESQTLHAENLELGAEIARRRSRTQRLGADVGSIRCAHCRRGIAKTTDLTMVEGAAVHVNCAAWIRAG